MTWSSGLAGARATLPITLSLVAWRCTLNRLKATSQALPLLANLMAHRFACKHHWQALLELAVCRRLLLCLWQRYRLLPYP